MTRLLLSILLAVAAMLPTAAQRRITPVVPKVAQRVEDTDTAPDRTHVVETTDLNGRVVLVDTLLGKEFRDTVLLDAPKLKYPLFDGLTVGVNLWDALMRATGQHYGLGGAWAELSLHNWFKPYLEVGAGGAHNTPEISNYTYDAPAGPYFKLGLNYNFLYNSNPDYSIYFIVRYGMARTTYTLTDVHIDNPYWDESLTIGVPRQSSTCGYFEAGIGLRVAIAGGISLGWELKAHTLTSVSGATSGKPWYVPGYGTRGGLFTGSLSVSYTLPWPRRKLAATAETPAE